MAISRRIHETYETALVNAGINPFRVSCPICRLCKVCGVGNQSQTINQPSIDTEDNRYVLKNPKRKSVKTVPDDEELSQQIQRLQDHLTAALSRIDTLTSLNHQALSDLAEEKNKLSQYEVKFEELRHKYSTLQHQEVAYLEKITKLEATLKLAEACRSQTTKEMRKSKLELRSLQKDINEAKCENSILSIERSMRSIMQGEQFPDGTERCQQILLTVQSDLKELIQLIQHWNRSLESIFMTQPNQEQEWLGLLSGLCISMVERIEIVQNLLLNKC